MSSNDEQALLSLDARRIVLVSPVVPICQLKSREIIKNRPIQHEEAKKPYI
jgi:hypothetical protein